MAMEFKEPEWLSMAGSLTGEHALHTLLRAGQPGGNAAEPAMFAERMTDIDVVGGAATRLRIHRHLREHSEGQVTIVPPHDEPTAVRLLELLSPLPDRVVLSDDRAPPDGTRYALLQLNRSPRNSPAQRSPPLGGAMDFSALSWLYP